eukprot:RCo035193
MLFTLGPFLGVRSAPLPLRRALGGLVWRLPLTVCLSTTALKRARVPGPGRSSRGPAHHSCPPSMANIPKAISRKLYSSSPPSPPAGLRELVRVYGAVGGATYLALWTLSFVLVLFAVRCFNITAEQMAAFMEWSRLNRLVTVEIPKQAGDLALAWVANHASGPLRFVIVLAITPRLARVLRGKQVLSKL